ncbi:MAG TPA: hypothetical protein VF666_16235 [Pyrinomonadaceae bacterium]
MLEARRIRPAGREICTRRSARRRRLRRRLRPSSTYSTGGDTLAGRCRLSHPQCVCHARIKE